jgi:hypothetical protein
MGFWNKLFGGADGCREAMRESYEKHVRLAQQGQIGAGDSPHACGLYGALGTRYIVRGTPKPEVFLWSELAPFLAMREDIGLKALLEYVLYQEYPPGNADVAWLRQAINSALRSCAEDQWLAFAGGGLINQVAWCDLLESDTRDCIEHAVGKLGQQ